MTLLGLTLRYVRFDEWGFDHSQTCAGPQLSWWGWWFIEGLARAVPADVLSRRIEELR